MDVDTVAGTVRREGVDRGRQTFASFVEEHNKEEHALCSLFALGEWIRQQEVGKPLPSFRGTRRELGVVRDGIGGK
jgi:hypothetical protein